MDELRGQVALVTGGGRGIGANVARELAQAGMRVAVAARTHEQVAQIAEERTKVNWALYEPYAFAGPTPGSMSVERWRETIAFVSRTHDLPAVPEEQLVRAEIGR